MGADLREPCVDCGETGWTIKTRDGRDVAVRCACRLERAKDALLAGTRIPPRYARCTLENFFIWDKNNASLSVALRRTRELVDSFPVGRRGLLFMGSVGAGKTHLAVAALRALVEGRGIRGLYANFSELVLELQMSFDGGGRSREEILGPVLAADLLVLDELGAAKPTPWVMDIMYYVVNSRYMAQLPILATTNFRDAANGEGQLRAQETLADRVSAPVRSRLHEMCDVVPLTCGDYRYHIIAEKGRQL